MTEVIDYRGFRSEEIEIVMRLTLIVALVAHAEADHIGQCAKTALELGKAIDILIMESVNGIDIISVAVARVFELVSVKGLSRFS